jgi:hypothetical protein
MGGDSFPDIGMLWDPVSNTCHCGSDAYLVKVGYDTCFEESSLKQNFYTCNPCPDNSTTCSDYTGYA